MPDKSLLLLAKDVRSKTLRILEGVTEQQSKFTPPGLQNHILWHAGHILVVVEYLALSPAGGGPPPYPQAWSEKFNWESRPATVKDWPPLPEVISQLATQFDRLTAALNLLTEQQLSKPIGDDSAGRDLRWSILHGLHDEANHQGEMWLLKKMQTKRP